MSQNFGDKIQRKKVDRLADDDGGDGGGGGDPPTSSYRLIFPPFESITLSPHKGPSLCNMISSGVNFSLFDFFGQVSGKEREEGP